MLRRGDSAAPRPGAGRGDHRLGRVAGRANLARNHSSVCLALALYGVAPTLALAAGLVLTWVRRGRPFRAGVALGALLLVPAGVALASLIG